MRAMKVSQQCLSKVRHRSKKYAQEACEKMMEMNPTTAKLIIYKCPFCGGYHIGRKRTKKYW